MKISKLPNLDESVLEGLNFFIKNKPKKLNLKNYNFPIVVGSGNAYNTGKIIFSGQAAVFANESTFKNTLKAYAPLIKSKTIKQAIIISASGGKDAAWEIKLAKKNKLKTTLFTCNAESEGAKLADEVILFRKNAEPQTYNISTYLGIILAVSGESILNIQMFIKNLKLPKNFKKYKAYAFILPDEFTEITGMLDIKKHELFGPYVSIRSFSYGEARHAKFVNPTKEELVISLGENKYFGEAKHRLEIKLPKNAGAALIMALTYYIIGKVQAAKKPYFKNNIAKYCLEGPKTYGKKEPFKIIVE